MFSYSTSLWGILVLAIIVVIVALIFYLRDSYDVIEVTVPDSPPPDPASFDSYVKYSDACYRYDYLNNVDMEDWEPPLSLEDWIKSYAPKSKVEQTTVNIVESLADLPVAQVGDIIVDEDGMLSVSEVLEAETSLKQDTVKEASIKVPVKKPTGAAKGKLAPHKVKKIFNSKKSIKELAIQYEVSESTIKRIRDRKTYLDVAV